MYGEIDWPTCQDEDWECLHGEALLVLRQRQESNWYFSQPNSRLNSPKWEQEWEWLSEMVLSIPRRFYWNFFDLLKCNLWRFEKLFIGCGEPGDGCDWNCWPIADAVNKYFNSRYTFGFAHLQAMRQVLLERDILIAINGPFWVEVAHPEHPFTAMLISRFRSTCLIESLIIISKPVYSILPSHSLQLKEWFV